MNVCVNAMHTCTIDFDFFFYEVHVVLKNSSSVECPHSPSGILSEWALR